MQEVDGGLGTALLVHIPERLPHRESCDTGPRVDALGDFDISGDDGTSVRVVPCPVFSALGVMSLIGASDGAVDVACETGCSQSELDVLCPGMIVGSALQGLLYPGELSVQSSWDNGNRGRVLLAG